MQDGMLARAQKAPPPQPGEEQEQDPAKLLAEGVKATEGNVMQLAQILTNMQSPGAEIAQKILELFGQLKSTLGFGEGAPEGAPPQAAPPPNA